LGDSLEAFDYTKNLSDSFEDLVYYRLKQLREKYAYIRFWFSGGRDSRLVLDACRRYNIHFDEIVILRHCPVGRDIPMGGQVETDANAIKYLKDIDYNSARITVINLDNDHYDAVFRNPNWYRHGSTYTFHAALYQSYFFEFVNKEFQYFDVGDDIVDLLGCIQPHVYWSQDHWKFGFIDKQFFNQLRPGVENFLVTNQMPEILQVYVRDLTRSLEKMNLRLERFQTTVSAEQTNIITNLYKTSNQQLRDVRNLVSAFRDIIIPRPDLETPKGFLDPWRPSDHYFWQVNDVYKPVLSCMMLYNQTPWSPAFDHYVHLTDWDKLKWAHSFGGICSKEMIFLEN
jgi:hypothetical protein